MDYQQPPAYPSAPPTYTPVPTQTYQTETVPLVVQHQVWGEIPQRHTCQFCGQSIVTTVVYENGLLTWLVAGGICLVGCWLGCFAIPFFLNSLKDPVHLCPACNNVVGKKNRI
jgi:lipopolysaccharide-induced tumor necrosis factor-alpha factor